jgi:hypothetical protein
MFNKPENKCINTRKDKYINETKKQTKLIIIIFNVASQQPIM